MKSGLDSQFWQRNEVFLTSPDSYRDGKG